MLALIEEDAVHEFEFVGGFNDAGFVGLSIFEFMPGVAPGGGHISEHLINDTAFSL